MKTQSGNIKVAYYGEQGSFSEEGALSCFRDADADFSPCGKKIGKVFETVVTNKADYGVVPVENSNTGIIYETYDLLLKEKIFVVKEYINKIDQYLLANNDVKIGQVKKVYSHPAALFQCKKYLNSRDWETFTIGDTASAVKKVKNDNLVDAAAVASKKAAKDYGMQILRENIQDSENDYTRFFVIGKKQIEGKHDKTSIVLGLRNGLNSLHEYMGFFVKRRITIVKLDSRPDRDKPFDYIIYMDFQGNMNDRDVKDAMSELVQNCGFVRFLGSYKACKYPFQIEIESQS